jgi:antirestriction protein
MLESKIYVACLAAYNSSHLHGGWIDANQDIDSLLEEMKKILAKSPIQHAEEWAIHDYEDFGSVQLSEYAGLETVSQTAKFIAEHGELGAEVISHTGVIEKAQNLLDECYQGEFDSAEDFSYYWIHEVDGREIPEYLQYYIDYKAMARDWMLEYYAHPTRKMFLRLPSEESAIKIYKECYFMTYHSHEMSDKFAIILKSILHDRTVHYRNNLPSNPPKP